MTERIGLVATCATTYNEPYNVARAFASIDHLSGGRGGWNLVTGGIREDALNFNLTTHVAHADRYERAEEFIDVCLGLWDSFEDDAIVADKVSGAFSRPREASHAQPQGQAFRREGPALGRAFAARATGHHSGRRIGAGERIVGAGRRRGLRVTVVV